MEVSWYCWVTVISLVTNFHGCLCWPTLQPPLRPVTSKHELDSDESRKVLGSSVVTSVSVIMDHGNGTKTFLSDGIENPELKTNIIGSPGNLLNPDKYEFYTFDETGDLVKRLMTWDEIQGLIAGGEGEGILGEASMPMYYSDSLPDKMGSTHITANDFQTSDIQGVHKVVESVQNVLKSELAASQSKIPPIAKPTFISNTPNWSLFLPSVLDNAEDGSELNNLPGMLISPSTHFTTMTTGVETNNHSNLLALANVTEAILIENQNGTEIPSTNSFTDITTTTFKDYTKKPDKPNRYKVTTLKPSTTVKNTFIPPTKTFGHPIGDNFVSTFSSTPFKKYTTNKYSPFSTNDHWFTSTTLVPLSTSKKNENWYSTSSTVPTSSKKNEYWHSSTSPVPSTSSKKNDNWFSTVYTTPTPSKKPASSSKYGGYQSNESTTTATPFTTRKMSITSNKLGEFLSTNKFSWISTATDSTSTPLKTLTTSKYGGYTTNNELFASIANVLHQVTDDIRPTGSLASSSPILVTRPPSTQQYKVSTESTSFTIGNKHEQKFSTESSIPSTIAENQTAFITTHGPTEAVKLTASNIFKTGSSVSHKFSIEPTRFTVTVSETSRPPTTTSYKLPIDSNIKFTDKNNLLQHKFSTESYYTSDNRKTVPPFSQFTSGSNKYFTTDKPKSTLPGASQGLSTDAIRYSSSTELKPTSMSPNKKITMNEITLSTMSFENNSMLTSLNKGEHIPNMETPVNFNNYVPLNIFGSQQNDTHKSTKTYISSTISPLGYVTLQKQPLTMKPLKPIKSSTSKSTVKPADYLLDASVTKPQSTVHTFTVTEKPLVRISTLSSILTEPTTTHPEALVTWISTFPLEETPSKVALNGVFDSDKLVTEQYVSSYHNRQPIVADFFKNLTTAVTSEESTHTYTSINASSNINNHLMTTSPINKIHVTASTLFNNNIPTAQSVSIFDSSRPFRTSERPFYTVESKTEPISASTLIQHYPTTNHHHTIHTVPTEFTEIKVIKTTTTKPATSPLANYNYSSSETVMQRVPTINPPSKLHSNSSGHKSSSKPQYLSTEATKNVTQIAVMLNKSNDTVIKTDLQQRNKLATGKPILGTTNCITSSISNHTTESIATMPLTANSHAPSSSAVTQKENSHIYYYKLPPITSSPQQELHSYHYKSTMTTTMPTIANIPTTSRLSWTHKPEIANPTIKSSTEKEYERITTVNHPSNDFIQNGISAVTNILLQTEGRVPNKEFVESDSTAAANSTSSHLTTEHMLHTEQFQSHTRSAATTNSVSNHPTAAVMTAATNKPQNITVNSNTTTYSTYSSPSTTTTSTIVKLIEPTLTTVANENSYNNNNNNNNNNNHHHHHSNHSNYNNNINNNNNNNTNNNRYNNNAGASVDLVITTVSSITTAEAVISADNVNNLTSTIPPPTTTNISSDFRNDFVIDDRNITREEEEDVKNYHPYKYTTANRSGNGIKNATTVTTPMPTMFTTRAETPKQKITSTTASTTKSTTTSHDAKITPNFSRVANSTASVTTTSTSTASTTTSTTQLNSAENMTKVEKVDDEKFDAVPPSAFRNPSGGGGLSSPTPKVPVTSSSSSSGATSSTTGIGVELHPAPHESMGLEASVAYLGDDVKRFIDFCNELSFKIWTSQTGKSLVTSRSIVLSPFAVLSTLAMIFLGARGSSSGIMNDFLRLDDMVTFNPHQVIQNITESVVNAKNIGVANAAFVREIFSDKGKGKVLDFYKERLQQYYDTHVEEITFNIIGDLVRRRTNLLIKRQTQGKIQDYLRGSALVLKPPLAVLTANIFQTDCDAASTEGRDGEMYFVVRPSTRQRRLVPIPAVVYRNGFLAGYEPGLDATAVTLNPESVVSTILVLPGQQGQVAPGDGLARLEQRLLESSYRRGAWSRLLRSLLFRPGLELQIPRFSHKSVLNLTAGLQKMGMAEIFAPDKADLRGINGVSNELHLSDIVQVNTFSTCGEETVDARHHIETYPSSPQRVGRNGDIFDHSYLEDSVNNYYSSLPLNLRPRQARLPDNPRLRFDRPFLYIVRHNPTGLILYIGRFNPRLLP